MKNKGQTKKQKKKRFAICDSRGVNLSSKGIFDANPFSAPMIFESHDAAYKFAISYLSEEEIDNSSVYDLDHFNK